MRTLQIGAAYRFAPGGYEAYSAWYAALTHENQSNGLDASDTLIVERLADEFVVLRQIGGFVVNIRMPAQYIGEWLAQGGAE
jgi:hypothetical protein